VAERRLPRGVLKLAAASLESMGVHPGDDQAIARGVLTTVLPAIERAVLKQAAQHILLLEALANGWACPACHGKPASTPSYLEARTGYRCGCGREWEPVPVRQRPTSMEAASLVRLLARGKPLPDLPPKENESA
jgi:hypothetical protein